MSNKYYAERNHVLRLAQTGRVYAMSAETYEDAQYAAETLNKLQARIDTLDELVDIACDIVSDAVIINECKSAEGFFIKSHQFKILEERLDKVRPKTKEQLLDMRLAAADEMIEIFGSISIPGTELDTSVTKYHAAKKAHES